MGQHARCDGVIKNGSVEPILRLSTHTILKTDESLETSRAQVMRDNGPYQSVLVPLGQGS